MKRSVVTHHQTAGGRSLRATSRWMAGSMARCRSGRGSKGGARATPATHGPPWPQLPPDQSTVGHPARDRMPVPARPQPALVPSRLAFGRFRERLDGLPPLRLARQLLPHSRGWPGTPAVLLCLGLPARGPLAPPPAHLALPVAGQSPTPHRHTLLAPPPVGPMTPAEGAPLPAGHRPEPMTGPLPRARRPPRRTHPAVRGIPPSSLRDHTALRHTPGVGLLPQPQPDRGLGLKPHLRGDGGFLPAVRGLCLRLRPGPSHRYRSARLRIAVAATHGNLVMAPLAEGPRVLAADPARGVPCCGNAWSIPPQDPISQGSLGAPLLDPLPRQIVRSPWPGGEARRHAWLAGPRHRLGDGLAGLGGPLSQPPRHPPLRGCGPRGSMPANPEGSQILLQLRQPGRTRRRIHGEPPPIAEDTMSERLLTKQY
jgi:hypothetical protein